MSGAVLVAEGLGRRHGGREVVAGAALELAAGERVAVLGPSGSGKTSLLLMLGLLDRPSSGRVLLEGVDAWAGGATLRAQLRAARLGFVFQQGNLLPGLTARENAALPAWRETGDRRGALARADALLAAVGLAARAGDLAAGLSIGEAQRVAVARALVNRPAVVLADEPTGALDSAAAGLTLTALEAAAGDGAALLVVTHDAAVAARAQRRFALHDGRLVAQTKGVKP